MSKSFKLPHTNIAMLMWSTGSIIFSTFSYKKVLLVEILWTNHTINALLTKSTKSGNDRKIIMGTFLKNPRNRAESFLK